MDLSEASGQTAESVDVWYEELRPRRSALSEASGLTAETLDRRDMEVRSVRSSDTAGEEGKGHIGTPK